MRSALLIVLLMFTLLLQFAGADAFVKKTDPHDFCAGYAICR